MLEVSLFLEIGMEGLEKGQNFFEGFFSSFQLVDSKLAKLGFGNFDKFCLFLIKPRTPPTHVFFFATPPGFLLKSTESL